MRRFYLRVAGFRNLPEDVIDALLLKVSEDVHNFADVLMVLIDQGDAEVLLKIANFRNLPDAVTDALLLKTHADGNQFGTVAAALIDQGNAAVLLKIARFRDLPDDVTDALLKKASDTDVAFRRVASALIDQGDAAVLLRVASFRKLPGPVIDTLLLKASANDDQFGTVAAALIDQGNAAVLLRVASFRNLPEAVIDALLPKIPKVFACPKEALITLLKFQTLGADQQQYINNLISQNASLANIRIIAEVSGLFDLERAKRGDAGRRKLSETDLFLGMMNDLDNFTADQLKKTLLCLSGVEGGGTALSTAEGNLQECRNLNNVEESIIDSLLKNDQFLEGIIYEKREAPHDASSFRVLKSAGDAAGKIKKLKSIFITVPSFSYEIFLDSGRCSSIQRIVFQNSIQDYQNLTEEEHCQSMNFLMGIMEILIQDKIEHEANAVILQNSIDELTRAVDFLHKDFQKNNCDAHESLIHAITENHHDIVRFLAANGCNVNIQNKWGETALHMAALFEQTDGVRCLVDSGCNVNIQNKWGETALHMAALFEQTDAVRYLAANGCDVNIPNSSGATALHAAARHGHTDGVRCLVDGDCNVNIQNKWGETALHMAARHGHTDAVRYLAANGCDVNIPNSSGATALHAAARHGHTDGVRCLVDGDCNVNIQNKWGETALHAAARHGHTDAVHFLAANGRCNVNIQNKWGETALHMAARHGHTDAVHFLAANGCDVNIRDQRGRKASDLN